MILSWYISLIYIIDIFVPTLAALPCEIWKFKLLELYNATAKIIRSGGRVLFRSAPRSCGSVRPSKWPDLNQVKTKIPAASMPTVPRSADCLIQWFKLLENRSITDYQFAFRPTGSTTCALVFFIHHLTRLLETNSYVRCLLVDFPRLLMS